MAEQPVLTVPNALSVLRLLCAPLFVWLLVGSEDRVAAFALLAVLAGTDWVDGWIARRFDQGSDLGKVLDPVADRVLLLTAAIALTADGTVPAWVGIAVLVREAIVSAATLGLAAAGAARIDVQWAGKAGTFGVLFALPGFLLRDVLEPGIGRDIVEVITWTATAGGLVLGYYAAARYIPIARDALRAGRANRPHRATEMARP
jgi:cardiolipin synthase (CMP-forming)